MGADRSVRPVPSFPVRVLIGNLFASAPIAFVKYKDKHLHGLSCLKVLSNVYIKSSFKSFDEAVFEI